MPKISRHQFKLTEVYRFYKNNTEDPVDYKTHKAVLELWGSLVKEYLLDGKDVKLYSGLAMLGVRKKFVKHYVDKGLSRIHHKKVLMPNTHSDFYLAHLYWGRRRTNFKVQKWRFVTARKFARSLAVVMKMLGGHRRYVKMAVFSRTREQALENYKHKVLKI